MQICWFVLILWNFKVCKNSLGPNRAHFWKFGTCGRMRWAHSRCCLSPCILMTIFLLQNARILFGSDFMTFQSMRKWSGAKLGPFLKIWGLGPDEMCPFILLFAPLYNTDHLPFTECKNIGWFWFYDISKYVKIVWGQIGPIFDNLGPGAGWDGPIHVVVCPPL